MSGGVGGASGDWPPGAGLGEGGGDSSGAGEHARGRQLPPPLGNVRGSRVRAELPPPGAACAAAPGRARPAGPRQQAGEERSRAEPLPLRGRGDDEQVPQVALQTQGEAGPPAGAPRPGQDDKAAPPSRPPPAPGRLPGARGHAWTDAARGGARSGAGSSLGSQPPARPPLSHLVLRGGETGKLGKEKVLSSQEREQRRAGPPPSWVARGGAVVLGVLSPPGVGS